MTAQELYELLANITDEQLQELMRECEKHKVNEFVRFSLYEGIGGL
jgi:hypothetical protein